MADSEPRDTFPRDDLQLLADHPQLHREIFGQLGHGVVVISEDGFVLDANQAHLDQIGRRREELVGQFSPVYTHPDDLEAMFPVMLDLITGARDEVRIAYRFVHGNGEPTRCRITARRIALPDDAGHVVAIAYDPDDDPADALDEAETMERSPLHLFFGRAAFTVSDLDGRIARVARQTAELLGRSTDELVGLQWSDPLLAPIFPDGRPFTAADDPVFVAAAHGTSTIDIVGLKRPDGSRAWVSMQCTLSPFRGGKSVVTSLTDITAVVKAHEDRSRLASIVDVAVDLVAAFDLEGRCLWLNTSAERHLGTGAHGLTISQVTDAGTRSKVDTEVLPALHAVGRWSGELELTVTGRALPLAASVIADHDDERRIIGYTLVGHDLSIRKALEVELAHRATHDELTGIPNRALLAERLAATAPDAGPDTGPDGGPDTVVFVDLRGFKAVNDTHGHAVGDLALIEVARRLATSVGPDGFVARYGGDEFVVLPDPTWADPVARLREAAFSGPVIVGDLRLDIDADVGIARREPGESADVLLARADHAMYDAKAAARGAA